LAKRFITIADSWSYINSVAFITPDGMMRVLALRDGDGDNGLHVISRVPDASNESFFKFLRDSPKVESAFYIVPPGVGLVSGIKVLRVTKAVYDAEGHFIGVSVVTIALDCASSEHLGQMRA